MAIIIY